jgi:cystathionine gamma-synthase
MSSTSNHPETVAIHGGYRPDANHSSVTPDLITSTVFEHGPAGFGERPLAYSRHANPNRLQLEKVLTSLEHAYGTATFSSGVAAVSAVFQSLKPGDEVLISDDVYSGTRSVASLIMAQWGLTFRYVAPNLMPDVSTAATRLFWLETPSNPLLRVADIEAIAAAGHKKGILTIVDNTWATPVLQQPLTLGADLVLHSATKYMGGHSDILSGAVMARENSAIFQQIRTIQAFGGAVPAPFDCWLLLRSLKTMPLRVERQCENAMEIAEFLEQHPQVEGVYYPGLPSHPQYEIAKKQMRAPGAMISFLVKGGKEAALRTVSSSEMIIHATSLGGVESTWEQRATSEGPASTTPPNLIRLSVGAEHVDDIKTDLEHALEHSKA